MEEPGCVFLLTLAGIETGVGGLSGGSCECADDGGKKGGGPSKVLVDKTTFREELEARSRHHTD